LPYSAGDALAKPSLYGQYLQKHLLSKFVGTRSAKPGEQLEDLKKYMVIQNSFTMDALIEA